MNSETVGWICIARQPGVSHCRLDVLPLARGLVAVQVPAGAANNLWDVPLKASNVITRNSQYAPGSLRLTIGPPAAVAAGACWRRVGTSTWLKSDDTVWIISNDCTIEFLEIDGWIKPLNQKVMIGNDQTKLLPVNYIRKNSIPGEEWINY